MKLRIAIWALAGVIAAAGWGLYFSIPGNGPAFSSWALVYLTIPIAVIGRHIHMPMTVYQTVALNALTYALIGLALEGMTRSWRFSRYPHP
jgi:hypothetical protein